MKYLKACILALAAASISQAAEESIILSAMKSELDRSMKDLVMEGHEKPYFISYRITDQTTLPIQASMGTLTEADISRSRRLAVDVRIGSYDLDNTGLSETLSFGSDDYRLRSSIQMVPVDDDTAALKHKLWLATDYEYKKAVDDMAQKKKELALKPEDDEAKVADFSSEDPEVYTGEEVSISVDEEAWQDRIKRYSAMFVDYPDITISSVRYEAKASNIYYVNSEGTRIQDGEISYSIELEAHARSKDGMPLIDYKSFTSRDGIFDEGIVKNAITEMAEGLVAISRADESESYVGPVLIAAPVSGTFIEKTLAPLISASKQSWENDGALKNKVGERILPSNISVYDDPTISSYKRLPLAGFYRFDAEGVPAQKVSLITNGVLRGFLTSRSPVKGFSQSNGHGRSSVGIGNLIMESSAPLSFAQLKSRLVSECRKQAKSYGLLITSAVPGDKKSSRKVYSLGGLTIITMGASENLLEPVSVYKVYADGRQELLRGVEVLSSSPLATLAKIIAVGADHEVWNISSPKGSIVAPSILVSELEVRKATGGEQTLPILPAPE
ncbi:hypothetical protein JXM67_11385 [candidate division WOR-3 bacterium]|nr:hypothetical protein [candidate division WOR-3 bacterium]